ncbi:hypothetical protein [Deinococcus radiotolerans]|uniref:Sodium:proton antiporter n=1 Tax=Deinococcus radiotolerans TaxID=1309407 RepID=A0ABQ2FN12_9DEIO|nr:hypothetical protein [Deinococcus radiotolerans]GGL09318.1 hypothetical protein GCM10010844_30020 [Deinococcus radiotolerans]
MTLPLLLCALIALTAGLHFGARAAQARRARMSLLPALTAHGSITCALLILAALLDPTDSGLLWAVVGAVSVAGPGLGALWTTRRTAQGELDTPEPLAPSGQVA